jgi:predicted nucleic acid-binding protein
MPEADAVFFDSNILLYFFSKDDLRNRRAKDLLSLGGHVSVQVLNEVTSVARKKFHISWANITDMVTLISQMCEIHPLTVNDHTQARRIAERYQLHIYDAQIIASAKAADCTIVYTEDMQHSLMIENQITIINPFL